MAIGRDQEGEPLEEGPFTMNQDELQTARTAQPAEPTESSSTSSVRCVGGRIARPSQREEESPSTACNSSTVSITTPGGVQLGSVAQPPCFGPPPGIAQAPSIPLPPPPSKLVIGEYIADCRDLSARMDILRRKTETPLVARFRDTTIAEQGPGEMTQIIQEEAHAMEGNPPRGGARCPENCR